MSPPIVAERVGRGRVSAVRVLLFALGLTFALAPLQAHQYFSLAEFPDRIVLRAAAVVVVAGATVALMTPGVLLAIACSRWAVPATVAGVSWAVVVSVWIVLDLLVQRQTGNRLTYYFKFALQPDALRWAGNSQGLIGLFGQQGAMLAAYLGAVLLAVVIITRRFGPSVAGRVWPARVLAVVWVALLAVGPGFQRLTDQSRAFMRLNDAMVVPWNVGFARPADVVAATEERATDVFRRYHDRLGALPVVPADVPEAPATRPDVVVIVVDGLRRDALVPEIMPRIRAWSERGARFDAHISAANGSEWGTFGMLYGLTPYAFVPIVQSGIPPTLLSVLWRWGYQTHFVTSGTDSGWLLIGKFLGPKFFTVHTQPAGRAGWENDRDSIATLRTVLASGGPPKFVFVWLAATHWLYSSPEEYRALMLPLVVAPAPEVVTQRWQVVWARMYARAARYVDDLVGEWLEGLDLSRHLVVFTADHGEAIYDDGFVGHGPRLSSAEIQVPFVLAGPGVPPGTVVDAPSGNFDLAPTLLHVLGDRINAERTMFGAPLLPTGRERSPYTVAYRPVDESAVALSGSLSVRDTLREVVFVAQGERYGIRLDPQRSVASRFGPFDERGVLTGAPVMSGEAARFLGWFEDALSRSVRVGQEFPRRASSAR